MSLLYLLLTFASAVFVLFFLKFLLLGCACTDANQPGCSGVTNTCPNEGCVRCKTCPLGYYGGVLNDQGCDTGVGPADCLNNVRFTKLIMSNNNFYSDDFFFFYWSSL